MIFLTEQLFFKTFALRTDEDRGRRAFLALRLALFCYEDGAFVKKEYSFCEKYDISVKNTKKYLQNSKIYVIMER